MGTPGRGEQPADAIGVDGDKNTDGQVIMTARELEALLKESAQKALDASAVEIQALMDSKIEMESKFETVMNDMKRDNDEKMRTIGRIEARLEGETKQRQDVERQLHENMVEFESLQRAAAVLRQTSMRDDEDEKEARRLATIHDGKRGVVDDGASKRAMSASPQKPVSKRTKTDDVCVIDGDGHDGDDDNEDIQLMMAMKASMELQHESDAMDAKEQHQLRLAMAMSTDHTDDDGAHPDARSSGGPRSPVPDRQRQWFEESYNDGGGNTINADSRQESTFDSIQNDANDDTQTGACVDDAYGECVVDGDHDTGEWCDHERENDAIDVKKLQMTFQAHMDEAGDELDAYRALQELAATAAVEVESKVDDVDSRVVTPEPRSRPTGPTDELTPDKVALVKKFQDKAESIEHSIRKTSKADELQIYDSLVDIYNSDDMKTMMTVKGFSMTDLIMAKAPGVSDDAKVNRLGHTLLSSLIVSRAMISCATH